MMTIVDNVDHNKKREDSLKLVMALRITSPNFTQILRDEWRAVNGKPTYGWTGGFTHHAVNSFGIKDDGPELIDPFDLAF